MLNIFLFIGYPKFRKGEFMKRLLAYVMFVLFLVGGIYSSVQLAIPKTIKRATAEEVVEYQTEDNFPEELELCVIGNATKCFSPDSAKITAVIETLDMDISISKNKNFEIFEKVLEALKDAQIDETQIVLDSFSSYPSYDYNAGRTLIGYYSTTVFTFNVDNLDGIKTCIDTILEEGVTSIRNINYQLSNIDEVYQDVLLMAIDNAKTKAEKVTGGQEFSIKGIKEEYVYSCSSLYKTYSETLENSDTLIGDIEVSAKVIVEFGI